MPRPVLIVDDAADIRRTLCLVFEVSRIPTLAAGNGQEAFDLLAAGERPSVILLDWMMPVVDGRGFLERLARDPALRELPVYVLSAADRQPDTGELPILGWLKKPVAYDDVLTIAKRHAAE